MRNRKTVVTAFLLLACMLIGVGYAAVTDNLSIGGQATISQQGATDEYNEDIRFAGIVVGGVVKSDVLAGENLGYTASCNIPLDQASFHINDFKGKDDTKTIVFRVLNDGDLDSTLKLDALNPATNSNPTIFDITYKLGAGAGAADAFPVEGTPLAAGAYVDIYVTVTVKTDVNTETTADFTFKFTAENGI